MTAQLSACRARRELRLMPRGMGKICNKAMRGEGKGTTIDGA